MDTFERRNDANSCHHLVPACDMTEAVFSHIGHTKMIHELPAFQTCFPFPDPCRNDFNQFINARGKPVQKNSQ